MYDLHWAPIGAFAAGYPKLEARLAITPIDETSCLLTLAGAYRPPLGPIGHVADDAALAKDGLISKDQNSTYQATFNSQNEALRADEAAINSARASLNVDKAALETAIRAIPHQGAA